LPLVVIVSVRLVPVNVEDVTASMFVMPVVGKMYKCPEVVTVIAVSTDALAAEPTYGATAAG
jgi:hypothetical protein